MKLLEVKYVFALAAALFAFHGPVIAASSDELADISDQLRNLVERVERLERENEALKAQIASEQNPYLGDEYAGARPFSEEAARHLDAEVMGVINESHGLAMTLTRHRTSLDALVRARLARETLDDHHWPAGGACAR